MYTESADKIPLFYEITGDGKPSLVLVHGWCCDRSFWEFQVPYFEQKYTVVTLDLAGHGESGTGRKDWSMKSFGNDVAAVITDAGLSEVILVGHSMGGRVVAEAAAMLTDKVTGVVGVDCFQSIDRPRPSKHVMEGILSSMRTNLKTRIWEFVVSATSENASPALRERIALSMSTANPNMAADTTAALVEHDLPGVLAKLAVPVRCISAQYGPPEFEATQKVCKDFKAVYMQEVGHFAMMEDPDTFNGLLEGLIREMSTGI
ncbi:MAG: alpha/beta hydrolase [Dehalococcoidales bacterium]|nr:alpha/beta hydrolase [Dehalococcoidales bacterium]